MAHGRKKKKPSKPTKLSWRKQQKEKAKRLQAEERKRHQEVQARSTDSDEKRTATPTLSWPPPHPTPHGRDEYFLNPYNFVRYLSEPHPPLNDPDAQLLGRCAPPPHDRYVGLTGRITCTVETVTPLFISDSHKVEKSNIQLENGRIVEHKKYRFFQYEGQDAIPATSLRGMIRSVFEIVTNSPFSVFNSEERLEYRIEPVEARHFKPGIVRSLPKDGKQGTIALCKEAKVGAYYDKPEKNLLDPRDWRNGEEAYAIVVKKKDTLRVDMLDATRSQELVNDGRPIRHGWLKVTGATIDSKRNESFFYFSGNPKQAQTVSFDSEREADYNSVLTAQLERDDFKSQIQNKRLTPGDLVYVELEPDDKTVRHIALVRVARLRYRHAIGDLLPEHLKPSTEYDQLDMASRLFGWVRDAHGDSRGSTDMSERVAYAGRLRFSHATLTKDGDKGVYDQELSLAILGSPNPTTTLFYLQKKNGSWNDKQRTTPNAAETIGYDADNQLRGRKVYRHHGDALNRQEYERAGQQKQDHQNRTVCGVRVPGNIFQFTIDFHNLAPVELGTLLWVLQLSDEKCYYRLGYAKPLGFGSVRLRVDEDEIQLLDTNQRYERLDSKGGWRRATSNERGDWLERFEKAIKRCYNCSLRDLDNIRDLFALLREPDPQLPQHIHYPRLEYQPQPEGKNFEWFMANKRKSDKIEKAAPNHVLEIAGEESQGLPLNVKK